LRAARCQSRCRRRTERPSPDRVAIQRLRFAVLHFVVPSPSSPRAAARIRTRRTPHRHNGS
jgi:hypothetical protein